MSLVKKLSGKALIVAMAMAMLPASVAVPQNVNGAMGNVVASLFGATQAKADPWRQRHWDRGGYRGGGYYGRRDWRDSVAGIVARAIIAAIVATLQAPRSSAVSSALGWARQSPVPTSRAT